MGKRTDSTDGSVSRRTILKSSTVAAGFAGLAGCTGGGDGDDGGDGGDGDGTTPTATESPTPTTTAQVTGEPLRLGFSMPLTGQWGFLGQAVEPSIRMVVNRVNDMGGIDGRPIKLFIEDTKGKPSAGLTAARKQLNANNVDMYLGHSSFSIMQAVDIIQEAKIPWTVACSGTVDLIPRNKECGPYRTISNDSIEGWAAAIGARFERHNGVQDFENFGVITCKTADCKSLAGVHTEAYNSLGGNHVGTVEITSGQASYDTPVRRMRDMDPDIVYVMAGPPDVEKVLSTGVQIGFNPYWNLPSDFSTPDFLSNVPDQVMDRFFTYIDTAPEGVDQQALEEYTNQYEEIAGFEPGPCWNAAVDATNVLVTAAKAAAVEGSLEPTDICSQIRRVSEPPGTKAATYEEAANALENGDDVDLFGIISDLNFDQNGEVNVPFNQLIPNDAGDAYQTISTISPDEIAKAKQGNL